MIRFELSNGEVMKIPKIKANKMEFFKDKPGLRSEDTFFFTEFNPKTIYILEDYILGRELSQKAVLENNEIDTIANYLGDDNFILELKKARTLYKSKFLLIILREFLCWNEYGFSSRIEIENDIISYVSERKRITVEELKQFFEKSDYSFEKIIDQVYYNLYHLYKFPKKLDDNIPNLEKQRKINKISNFVMEREKIKQDFLDEMKGEKTLNGDEIYLGKEDAMFFLREAPLYIYNTTISMMRKGNIDPLEIFSKKYLFSEDEIFRTSNLLKKYSNLFVKNNESIYETILK